MDKLDKLDMQIVSSPLIPGLPVGEKIKKHRKLKGLTQVQLAESIDVTQEYISMVERGSCLPSLRVLSKIAEVLNIPIAELVDVGSDD